MLRQPHKPGETYVGLSSQPSHRKEWLDPWLWALGELLLKAEP